MSKHTNIYPRIQTAKFTLLNSKVVTMYPQHKTRRIFMRIKAGNFSKVYFRVEYGKKKTDHGELMFYNDGEYTNAEDAMQALKAFLE